MSYDVYGPYIVVVMLVTFLCIFAWVLHPKNRKKFDEAANIPLMDDDDEAQQTTANDRRDKK